MNIVEAIDDGNNKLEEAANEFAGLVEGKEYSVARDYFHQLCEDKKRFIRRNPEYNRWLKVLRFSNL